MASTMSRLGPAMLALGFVRLDLPDLGSDPLIVSCGPAIDRRTAGDMTGGRLYTLSGSDPWTVRVNLWD
jgi:hypothetical protein